MLLKIFKTSQPLSWFLIVALILIIRTGLFIAFFDPSYITETETNTPQFLLDFTINHPWISHILSTIFVLFASFYLNQITQKLNILTGINYLILLFAGIFLSFEPQLLILSPIIIATTIVLFSFPIILAHGKDELPLDVLFNGAFLVGISSLIYFPSILLLVAILISLFYVSHTTWRHFLIGSIGWITPWIFYDTIAFTFGNDPLLKITNWGENWQFFHLENFQPYVSVGILFLIIIIQSPLYLTVRSRSIIRIRKALSINYWYLITGFTSIGFLVGGEFSFVSILALPLSIFFSVFHLETKKWWVSDALVILLFTSLLLNHMRILTISG